MRRSEPKRQTTKIVLLIMCAILLVGWFALWAYYQIYPDWLPSWLNTLFNILAGLGALIAGIGAFFSDIVLALQGWLQAAPKGFRSVAVKETPPEREIRVMHLVTAQGHRVEGLSREDVAFLLQSLT